MRPLRSFWKYVKKLDRREARRYLEMFYILRLRPLIAQARLCMFRGGKETLQNVMFWLARRACQREVKHFLCWWSTFACLLAWVGGSLGVLPLGASGRRFASEPLPEGCKRVFVTPCSMFAQMKAAQDDVGMTEAAGVVQPNGTAK